MCVCTRVVSVMQSRTRNLEEGKVSLERVNREHAQLKKEYSEMSDRQK